MVHPHHGLMQVQLVAIATLLASGCVYFQKGQSFAIDERERVLVDGREIALRGDAGTVPVDPGTRVLRVERTGRDPTEQNVTVERGVLRVVEVRGDEGVTGFDDKGATKPRVLPWALLGGGGALVVTGAILFASSSGDARMRDDKTAQWCDAVACANGVASRTETPQASALRTEAYDAASRGNTKQVVGGIVGGAGAVSAMLGAYLLLQRAHGAEAAKRKVSGLVVNAAPLRGGGMASASMTF